jgi:tRNA A37 methylthiotransferase MiaB
LADVATNVAAGLRNVAVLSEDFFRYGAEGLNVRPEALVSLIKSIRRIPEVRLIQLDHANVLSIAQYDDGQLKTLHDLLVGHDTRRSVWVNVGIETASGSLLRQVGAAAKMRGEEAESWGKLCSRQLRRLCRAGFFPMASLMIGLPGEQDEHLRETLDWVHSLGDERMAVFPVLYAPIDGSPPLEPSKLRPLHWSLIRACYRLNFRWVPWIYADNQKVAGVPAIRRAALQLLGRGQILQWRLLFAWHAWRAKP